MTEDIQSVLSKVKKLLKLAAGKANIEESASAAAKAQELIDRHKLSLTDLEAETEAAAPLGEGTLRSTGKVVLWQTQLAVVIAKANSCKAYVWETGGKKNIQLVGTKENSEIVTYLFQYLSREINKLALVAIRKLELDGEDYGVKPKQYGHAFRQGCVSAIHMRLEAEKQALKQQFSSTALMRIDNQLARVEAFVKDKNLKPIQSRTQLRADGFRDGQAAGRNIALNKGLGGSNAGAIGAGRKLLG